MSLLYEAIGRMVVSLVSTRYRDEIRMVGVVAAIAALLAILWGLRAPGGTRPGVIDLIRAGTGSERKRRSGAFVSIR